MLDGDARARKLTLHPALSFGRYDDNGIAPGGLEPARQRDEHALGASRAVRLDELGNARAAKLLQCAVTHWAKRWVPVCHPRPAV